MMKLGKLIQIKNGFFKVKTEKKSRKWSVGEEVIFQFGDKPFLKGDLRMTRKTKDKYESFKERLQA